MPPSFELSLMGFYRPCWNAHERGPPIGQMRTELWHKSKRQNTIINNRSFSYEIIRVVHRNGIFHPSPPPLLSGADSTQPARVPPSRAGMHFAHP